MSVTKNLLKFKNKIPENIKLVAVSKTKSPATILETYKAGQRIFGENRVQELIEKQAILPKDIQWHFIGHLQKNKVKYIAPFINLIHGIDTLSCLEEINKQGMKNKKIISCLLQIKIAKENTKYGMSFQELEKILESKKQNHFQNVKIKGLMGMATFTKNKMQIQNEFESLKNLFEKHKKTQNWSILSTGMSGDYELAIENGSTMIRIGSAIFGNKKT